MTNRSDYIKCIEHTNKDDAGKSWCGRPINMDFRFISVDHAAYNGRNEGRLVACPECVNAIITVLQSGWE